MEWVQLAHTAGQWWTLVHTTMHFQVPFTVRPDGKGRLGDDG